MKKLGRNLKLPKFSKTTPLCFTGGKRYGKKNPKQIFSQKKKH